MVLDGAGADGEIARAGPSSHIHIPSSISGDRVAIFVEGAAHVERPPGDRPVAERPDREDSRVRPPIMPIEDGHERPTPDRPVGGEATGQTPDAPPAPAPAPEPAPAPAPPVEQEFGPEPAGTTQTGYSSSSGGASDLAEGGSPAVTKEFGP